MSLYLVELEHKEKMVQSLAAFLCLIWVCILLCLPVFTVAEPGNEESGLVKTSLLTNNDNMNDTGGAYSEIPTWCIAKPSADINMLQNNIDECCKLSQVDCSVINPGGFCYDPQNYASHASMAMNLYYKTFGKNPFNCNFSGTGLIVTQDPSWGRCFYPV